MREPVAVLLKAKRAITKTPQRIAAVLAGNSLFWQLLGNASDSVLASLVIATVTVGVRELRVIGLLFDYLLLFYLFYQFLPRLLPTGDLADEILGSLGVRLLLVLSSAPVGLAIGDIFGLLGRYGPSLVSLPQISMYRWLFVICGWVVLNIFIMVVFVYLSWYNEATVEDRLSFKNQVSPYETTPKMRREDLKSQAHGGWVTIMSSIMFLTANLSLLVLVCQFYGVLVGAFSWLFPLPEFIVILGVFADSLSKFQKKKESYYLKNITQRTPGLEFKISRILRHTLKSRKGFESVLFAISGFCLSALFCLLSILSIVAFVSYVAAGLATLLVSVEFPTQIPNNPVRWWNKTGGFLSVGLVGLYSLWYWYRQTLRLPHYLIAWERSHPKDADITSIDDIPELITRPPGYLLPTILPLYIGVSVIFDAPLSSPWNLICVFLWPVAIGILIHSANLSRKIESQPPLSDLHALPIALLVQLLWFWVLGATNLPLLLLLATLILNLNYLRDIIIYADRTHLDSNFTNIIVLSSSAGLLALWGITAILMDWKALTPQLGWLLIAGGATSFVIVFSYWKIMGAIGMR